MTKVGIELLGQLKRQILFCALLQLLISLDEGCSYARHNLILGSQNLIMIAVSIDSSIFANRLVQVQ